jgi:hypothetical protein
MTDPTWPETPAELQARRFELVDGDSAVAMNVAGGSR